MNNRGENQQPESEFVEKYDVGLTVIPNYGAFPPFILMAGVVLANSGRIPTLDLSLLLLVYNRGPAGDGGRVHLEQLIFT